MNQLNDELRNLAVRMGLCEQWQGDWKADCDKDELCRMYLRGLDFCIAHDYPSPQYMREHFDGVMQQHGIYVSQGITLTNPKILVASGHCTGTVNYEAFGTGEVHLRHEGELYICAGGVSKVYVSVYDRAVLHVSQSDAAKVYVYKYSEACRIQTEGNVVVRKKTLKAPGEGEESSF